MDIIVEKGCSLDVHEETLAARIVGTEIEKEIRNLYGPETSPVVSAHSRGSRQGGIPLQKRYSLWKAQGAAASESTTYPVPLIPSGLFCVKDPMAILAISMVSGLLSEYLRMGQ